MRGRGLIIAELEDRRGIDTSYAVPIREFILDEKIPKLNSTLEDILVHNIFDLTLSCKVLKDVVVVLILLHTDIIFCGDIKPQSIV